MKTLEELLKENPVIFSLDIKSVVSIAKATREEALDTVAALARKYNTKEFLEFADKVEALKSLP